MKMINLKDPASNIIKMSDGTNGIVRFEIRVRPENRKQRILQRLGWIAKSRVFEINSVNDEKADRIKALMQTVNISPAALDNPAAHLNDLIVCSRTFQRIAAIGLSSSPYMSEKEIGDFLLYSVTANELATICYGIMAFVNMQTFVNALAGKEGSTRPNNVKGSLYSLPEYQLN